MTEFKYIKSIELKSLLKHLKSIDRGLNLKIIKPKIKWPNIQNHQSIEVINIIREHHLLSQNSFGSDIGFNKILERSINADLWIHILDNKNKIIGLSINKKLFLNKQFVNEFCMTILNKHYKKLGIYPLLNELRIKFFPCDYLLVRTQNPFVYKYFSKLCLDNSYKVSPTINKINSNIIELIKELYPKVDSNSIQRSGFDNELLKNTPKPPIEIKPIWDRMDISNGDLVIIVGYKKTLIT